MLATEATISAHASVASWAGGAAQALGTA